ncbi:MAG: histidinol-phosphate transaminase [Sphingomonadales bacterium]
MTFDPKKIARQDILSLTPYSGRPEGKSPADEICLDYNESPFAGNNSNRYPGPNLKTLYSRLAELYAVDQDQLLITLGSDEGINTIIRAFCEAKEDNILICPPTFSMYETYAIIQGATTLSVVLDDNLMVDFDGLQKTLAKSPKTKIVFLCSPQNPAGSALPFERITNLSETNQNILFVIDEAYQEFSEEPSLILAIKENPNIVVLRTMSKAWGNAGARIGIILGHKDVISILQKIVPPYGIPSQSIDAVLETLTPAGINRVKKEIIITISERERLEGALNKHPEVIKIYPSQTNFLLIEFKDAVAIEKQLYENRIIVRNFTKSMKGCIRISVGTVGENSILLSALGLESPLPAERIGVAERTSKETSIFTLVNLDQSRPIDISTGIKFFDHMLEQLAKHSGISVTLKCQGDLGVDAHHTVEDCMITLGQAFKTALGDKRGIGRYGFSLPMDETRADVLIDLSGRGISKFSCKFKGQMLGELPTEMISHAIASFAESMKAAIHVDIVGDNDHHKAEGIFKGLARALKMATKVEGTDLPSTKGML